jgi:restriction system protein
MAEVESMNQSLANDLADIDGILAYTLSVDDYVDLEAMKVPPVEHPAFEPGDLGVVTPAPAFPDIPPEPGYVEPPATKALFGAEKKHAAAVAQAQQAFAAAHAQWDQYQASVQDWFRDATQQYQTAEEERRKALTQARQVYDSECQERENEAASRNAELAKLINGLAFDVEDAIQEYVGIVLANSVYPDCFPVSHDHEFSLATRELTLTALVPAPSAIPEIKAYKYVKSSDEISGTALTVKEKKDRYANAIWQVTLRTLHEVFEADRAGKIHSIALSVGVEAVNPATGKPGVVPLAVVAADRETFAGFDLANVVPQATLEHLGAALSKSPYDLTPADTARGVRARKQ